MRGLLFLHIEVREQMPGEGLKKTGSESSHYPKAEYEKTDDLLKRRFGSSTFYQAILSI